MHTPDPKSARVGQKNLRILTLYTGFSRLWFDGGLWIIYWHHMGFSLFSIGIFEALLHITCLVSDVPIGIFADRLGWRRSLAFSSVLGVIFCFLSVVSHEFLLVSLAFIARGLQVTFASGSDMALIYESARLAEREHEFQRISGRLLAVSLISMAVAESLGGLLAHVNWSYVYLAFALANLLSLASLTLISERTVRYEKAVTERPHASVRKIAREAATFARASVEFRKYITFSAVLSGFIATFAFYGQSLLQDAGWSLIAIGILTGAENGIGAVAALLSDRLTRGIGERRFIPLICSCTTLGLVLFSWLPGVFTGLGYLLNSLSGNLAEPLIDARLNGLIPSHQRATLLSANSTAFSLFMIVVFPIFGAVAEHIGLHKTAMGVSLLSSFVLLWATISLLRRGRISHLGVHAPSTQDVPSEVD